MRSSIELKSTNVEHKIEDLEVLIAHLKKHVGPALLHRELEMVQEVYKRFTKHGHTNKKATRNWNGRNKNLEMDVQTVTALKPEAESTRGKM